MIISSEQESHDFDVRAAYAAYHRQLFGFAVNGLGDRAAAEDCVQETFLRAWRARAAYRGDQGSPRTWLFAIARNVVIDALRSRSRQPWPVGDDGADAGEPSARTEPVEDRLVLLSALAQLSVEHREVVAAVQLDGLSYAQVADRTGVPVATLRTRNFYALKALRGILQEGDGHDR